MTTLGQVFHCHLSDLRQGGLSALGREVLTLLSIVPATLIVLILRALRPLVVVRFGEMETRRIGARWRVSVKLYWQFKSE